MVDGINVNGGIPPAIKLSSIRSNYDEEGIWEDIPEWPGVRLKVRSIRSRDYVQARDLAQQKLMRKLGRIPTSAEMDGPLRPILARYILRGWEGFDQPYSTGLAASTLEDPEHQPLAEQVTWAATRVAERDIEFTESATKNSGPPSATT